MLFCIPVGICGDLAADLTMTDFFLSLGVASLSVPPSMVLPLRERVRSLSVGKKPQTSAEPSMQKEESI